MTTATAVAEAPPHSLSDAVEDAAAVPATVSAPSADDDTEKASVVAVDGDAAVAVGAVARRWASLLSSARAESQAAFLLKQVGACPRCCLRFAGVRDAKAYAPPAPSSEALLAALVEGEGNGGGNDDGGKKNSEAPCSVCLGVLQAPDGVLELPLPSERMVAAAAAVDMGAGEWFPLTRGDGAAVAGVVEREGHCRPSTSNGDEQEEEEQEPSTSFFCPPPRPRVVSLQVSFPASVGLRQASASAALADAGLPPARPTNNGGGGSSLGPESITDVKDALKAAVAPLLSSSLSASARRGGAKEEGENNRGGGGGGGEEVIVTTANDADAAALTVSLMFVHPPTAREIELVPGLAGKGKRSRGWAGGGGRGKSVFVVEEHGGGGGGSNGSGGDGNGTTSLPPGNKGHWKKRKRVPAVDAASLGRAASQAVTQACSKLDGASLRAAGVAVPPTRLSAKNDDDDDEDGEKSKSSLVPASMMPHLLVRARASPLFIGGRYLKLERDVSQSPFFDEKGQRRGRTSVQEEIERHVMPLFGSRSSAASNGNGGGGGVNGRNGGSGSGNGGGGGGGGGCDGAKFVTAGREDVDVRCLGRGRPFVLEVSNARLRGLGPPTQAALDAARQRLKDSKCGVELAALAVVGRKELSAIKEGESVKQKSYEALCWLPFEVDDGVIEAINSAVARANEAGGGKKEGESGNGNTGNGDNGNGNGSNGRGLVLKQTTPSRVEHRRAMLVRERSIVEMSASRVEPGERPNHHQQQQQQQLLRLRLRTQAGLYVKEFVHGDGGRTTPSLVDVVVAAAASFGGGGGGGRDATEPAKCLSLDVCEVHLDFL